jgi:DNA polymerase-3 subunit gamma/tau
MQTSSSLYRKYRSQTFDELVGQEPVVRTLKNAIASDRISHAYLFTGPRGVGKTSAARLLARAANCTSTEGDKPCNKCPNCLAATRDIATDLIEIDAASNTGVDNIRELIERANFAPSVWNTKFYIVDEVHMLSTSAFNALLKTLEEPPPHTAFILATTEVHKVPATVASRCQRFDFRRVPLKAMVARLEYICAQEGIEAEPAALELVARQATGSLRDALSLLDQLRVFSEQGITAKTVQDMLGAGGSEEVAGFVDELIARDLAAGLRRINNTLDEGLDLRQFNRQVVEHLRGLMLVNSGAAAAADSLLDVTDEMRGRMHKQAEAVSLADLLRWVKAFGEADSALRSTVYGQLPLEMAFVAAVLKPEEPAAPQVASPGAADRKAELAESIQKVGEMPAQRTPRKQPTEAAPHVSTPPPPIHTEMGLAMGNGTSPKPAPAARIPAGPNPVDAFEIPEETRELEMAETFTALEPEPAPTSVPDKPPANGRQATDELARLVTSWAILVDQINARSKEIAGVLRNPELARPVAVTNGICVISFRWPIHRDRSMSDNPPRRDLIEMALSKVLGYPCRLQSITFDQEGAGVTDYSDILPGGETTRKEPRDRPAPHETTRGKAAINIFGIEKFDEPK